MILIKYRDTYDTNDSWFWTHEFKDGIDRVVSDVFETKQAAEDWAAKLKEKMLKSS